MFKSNEQLFRSLYDDKQATIYLQNEGFIQKLYCIKCNKELTIGKLGDRYKFFCYYDIRKGFFISVQNSILTKNIFFKTKDEKVSFIHFLHNFPFLFWNSPVSSANIDFC